MRVYRSTRLAALIPEQNTLRRAQTAHRALVRNRLVQHKVHAQRKHLADVLLSGNYGNSQCSSVQARSPALVKQRGYIRLFFAIEKNKVKALLRQPDSGARSIRTQLHLNAELFQDAAQHLYGGIVRANQE